MNKILVVEDEERALEVVEAYLNKAGYTVLTATDGREGLDLFLRYDDISLVVLDLMLPSLSGEEICQAIRRQADTPILMLTAKSAIDDRVNGLALGADDYLVKPFSPRELVARVKTLLRRTQSDTPLAEKLSYNDNDLVIYTAEHAVYKQGQLLKLTTVEYKLLMLLARYPRRVFSRNELIDRVLGADFIGYDRTIDTHIKNLRKKIETDSRHPEYIITVFGVGYKFDGGLS